MKRQRHDARVYDQTRRTSRWIDRRGEKAGRLLYLEWVGWWQPWRGKSRRGFWRALCDCGREAVVPWAPGHTMSCGCLQDEARAQRDFRTVSHDGTWTLKQARALILPDGRRFDSGRALARAIGLGRNAMQYRMKHWPVERWAEPPQPSGKGQKHRKRLRREWLKNRKAHRPQPWASASARKMTAANRERRHERPAEVRQVPAP